MVGAHAHETLISERTNRKTPNQTNLVLHEVLDAFKNQPIHGILHIAVCFAICCVLHSHSSQGIRRHN